MTSGPLWLLAELTYRCPMHCAYCSNPTDLAKIDELTTKEWFDVLEQGRALGALQLGLSGGEPLLRKDLNALVRRAKELGYYSNLITSGVGLNDDKALALKAAGLDHIQLSLLSSDAERNDRWGGLPTYDRKMAAARAIKAAGFPMVLNVVLHRDNLGEIESLLEVALDVKADYVELANVQYEGWAALNRDALVPTEAQVREAEARVGVWREAHATGPKVFFVVPDVYESRPKPCCNGWGKTLLVITPDGLALPCHGARQLPSMTFPSVRETPLSTIWNDSGAFNAFRGDRWMPLPCRECPERHLDFGGCRCQAFRWTGDPATTDPACAFSPHHERFRAVISHGANQVAAKATPRRNPSGGRLDP